MSFDPMEKLATDAGNRWLFRWVFHYADHKPAKVGGWHPAARLEDMATVQSRESLGLVMIEGKHFTSKAQRYFAEVPGSDFINIQHLAIHFQSAGMVRTHVYGMRIMHRHGLISCFENGEVLIDDRHYTQLNIILPESTRF
jgi:hypothetical protein